jgi:RNA polymerase sigma-70 factor (ECF subfamily)
MDEASFHVFYEQTARNLRAYLRSILNDHALVDDLVQESYFRIFKASLPADMDPLHRKNYLYRIAANLVHDHWRSRKTDELPEELPGECAGPKKADSIETAHDIGKAFGRLKPREQDLLWLAYVEGLDHKEIAGILRTGAASIRPMLSRARSRFSDLLRRRGLGEKASEIKHKMKEDS